MYPNRDVEFLRLGEQHVVIGMRMRLPRHHELRDPSAFASSLDRAFELDRRCRRIAERQMRNRDQLATALRAEVHDVPVVGARARLRELGSSVSVSHSRLIVG